ncbi:galactoside O-acetyltransferase [Limnohabitans sp. T6-5]|uniref:acyltransferase n=1 Tax=Limnohabitans sp. T6-5 TaxID=1100724 RepID=UPI000D353FA8|nr:acyltransferase [Limnohabitans sp. T6-5]PUE09132.1 galactoside O-acetyltransferase [Limnohabitans sp. T6-5]
MAMLNREQIDSMGFAYVGEGAQISDRASFYGLSRISIGDHSRIDDFCVLSAGAGGIVIGRHVHVAVYSSLIGAGRIELDDFCNLSSRVSIYSSSDDYSGHSMTNPTVPEQFTGVEHADVVLGRHVIVGSGSVILPGVNLYEGVAIGALSLVRSSCEAFGLYAGHPLKRLKSRSRDLLVKESAFLASKMVKG